MRRLLIGLGVLGFLAASIAVAVSCSAPPTTNYGNPNGLDRKNLPGDSGGITPLSCTGDGGAPTLPDGGCGISFTNDLLPYFVANGTWHCSDTACHGAGKTVPPVTCTDGGAAACITSLKAITVQGVPYLSGDGGGPAILCNLQGSCGNKMPQPPGKDPTNDDLCKIEAWLACGAPNN